jgi:hypothetical protein
MAGEFTVTGFAKQRVADGSDIGEGEDQPSLTGLTGTFVCNIPRNKPVPVPGGLLYLPPRPWVIDSAGQFREVLPDGSTSTNVGITLTANDPAFELTDPLQWQFKPNRFTLGGSTFRLASWWFDAPAPGWVGSIDALTPAPGVEQLGGTRGPRGFAVDDVDVNDEGAQFYVKGVPVGDRVDLSPLAFDPNDVGFDVVLIAGQSNAVGYAVGVSAIDTTYLDRTDSRISQWPGVGPFVSLGRPVGAVDPLYHHIQVAGCVGPAMAFARALVPTLRPNRKVLLVPCAHGGTGFKTTSLASPPAGYTYVAGAGGWDPSGGQGGVNLYEFTIAQANAAIAYNPNNRVLAAIWVQGEADWAMTQSEYSTYLDTLIDGFRSRITGAENMPFLVGQLVPERIALNLNGFTNDSHIDTPRRKLLTAFSYSAVGHNDGLPQPLHFDNEGQRLNGGYLAQSLALARANVLGTPPAAPGLVTLMQSGTTLLVSWARTPGRVTDYNVRYRVNAGAWTSLTRAQSIDDTASITGLASGNAVDVQARSVNEAGVSDWTASASTTLVYTPGQPTLVLGTGVGTTLPYTITAPTVDGTHGTPTGYLIEYKIHTDSTWLAFGTVSALTGNVTGLAFSTNYDVRAKAVNASGAGTASTTQTAMTGASTPLLDDIGASAYKARGLRQLRAAYSGSAIRVRYTDNTEADIGFAAGTNNLDTVTLLAGAAAHGGSAYIKTWYDQSGNSRNETQSTAANQARIVNSNTLDTANSKPAAVFSSSNYIDTTNYGMAAAGAASLLAVFSSSKGASSFPALATERSAVTGVNYNMSWHTGTGAVEALIGDDSGVSVATVLGPVLPDATLSQMSFVDTGSSLQNWINGATTSASGYSRSGHTFSTISRHTFGSGNDSSNYLGGQVCELVEFTAALTGTQRLTGQANQKSYYGTA